jgi:membrane fusion protein, macrolide-specific efflux system
MPKAPIETLDDAPTLVMEEGLPSPAKRSRKRMWLIIGIVVALIGLATGLTLAFTGSSPVGGLVIKNETVAVTTGTIKQTVAASGTLEPASQANLNFAVSGQVTAVDVKSGQQVTVGQVLATVGTSALEADLDAAQAQLSAAQDRLSSDESSDAATTQIDSDQASVTSAESSETTAQTNLSDASLTSTIAGTVASVDLTVGQQVTGSGGSGGGGEGADAAASDATGDDSTSTGQVTVIGTDSYLVNTTVDDTEVGQIAEGDQATITLGGTTTTAAATATPIYGTVASVGLIATETDDVADFPVVIDVTGDPTGLYAGATADVAIIVKQLNDVTEVPTAAITYSTSGAADVTEVVNGSDVTKAVTVGTASDGETQVTSGVVAGDKVVEKVITFKAGTGTGGAGLFGGTGGTGRLGGGGGFTRVGGFGGAGGGAGGFGGAAGG